MMQDKSTRFTLAATGILLAALIVLGWSLSRTAAAKRGGRFQEQPLSPAAGGPPVPPVPASLKEAPPTIPQDAGGKQMFQYQIITGTALMDDPANDGDTFLVKTPEGTRRFSLYYADAVETDGGQPESSREMAATFGFDSEEPLRNLGVEARDFSLNLLKSMPFYVVTRWEEAQEENSFYAFVYLKDPDKGRIDLSQWLIRYGLAMIRPCGRDCPDGTPAEQYLERLKLEETRSRSEGHGAWGRKTP